VVLLPGGHDPDTFLKNSGYDAFITCLKDAVPLMDFVLSQVVKGGAHTDIDDKVTLAGEMLKFIVRLPSSMEQSHFLKKTAEALDVSEADLRQEMAKAKKPVSPAERAHAVTSGRNRKSSVEETLIHLMLIDEKIAKIVLEQLQPEDFTDPSFRRAVQKMSSVLKVNGSLQLGQLLQDEDEELKNIFSHYAVLEMVEEDAEQSCQDCIDNIKQQNPEKKMKMIEKEMQDAEARGDAAALRRLQEELMALGCRPGRIKAKRVHGIK
jgi:DNA primase